MSPSNEVWPFSPGQSPFRIKGIVYRQLFLSIERDVPGGKNGLIAAIECPAMRDFASQPFLAASWYDNEPIVELNRLSAQLAGQDPQQFLEARALDQAREDLSGVYSWLLKLATPQLVAKGFQRITTRYFEWGETQMRELRPTHIQAVRSGVPERLVSWLDAVNRPFMQYAFEQCGVHDLQVALASSNPDGTTHGVPTRELIYSLRWR